MKKRSLKTLLLALLAMVMTFTACKDDDDPVLPPPGGGDKVELDNGYYVYSGDITDLTKVPANGLMLVTKNENGQAERATMFETHYMIDDANGFYIIKVTNGAVDFIGSSDVAKVDALNEEPNKGLWKGTTNSDSLKYTVDADGPYHITIDTELGMVTYALAEWGIVGAASPNGWNGNTPFPYKESDATKIIWEGTGIEMKTGGYKLRYSDGWKIFFGETTDAEVRVNTNLGGTLDALEPGGADMNWEAPGIYTITLTYTLGTGFTIATTKTGDVGVTDWSAVKFDVFGTGIAASNATARDDESSWAWGKAVEADNSGLPTVEGDPAVGAKFTYKWTNVAIDKAVGEGFGVRSVIGTDYNGSVYRYSVIDSLRSDFTIADSTKNAFGDINLNVKASGSYDVYLMIDAGNDDAASVTIIANGAYYGDVWSIIGSATPKGWNDNQMTPNATGTEWTFNGNLGEGEFKFRKNGDWAEQIGWNGTSWYFDGNAGTYAIAAGDVGTYTVVLDSETPNATVTKQ